ncbi:hypothetical protein VroAM7_50430 (plasmid) [Vibrio rotiferianus]|uniref:Uncharacterized protein n=1 Tax=Vibrio rotiferianus TaxID=190895 RepID=A0A510IJL8_9VIBR|nr:hypothetical protein [Vibrio rotiferianus]BBL92390.1 hypothetical protein VroAM7_50430 [Vibrio rotiferianus]
MSESKTIRKLKNELIKTMPYFPNTKEVKEELEAQSWSSVLFHYLNWSARLIPTRKRKVAIKPYLTMDSRWSECETDVLRILTKASLGHDLTDHLSNSVLSKGYTSKENIQRHNDSWLDKDQILNTKGFYHLHLKSGKSNKGNIVLFVQVTRNELTAVALFDHSVFDSGSPVLSPERERMRRIYDDIISEDLAPGSVYMSHPITTSGHPIFLHSMTQQYIHVINQVDSRLNDSAFHSELYEGNEHPIPKKPKFCWHIEGLDLGVYESKTHHFFIYRYGHI